MRELLGVVGVAGRTHAPLPGVCSAALEGRRVRGKRAAASPLSSQSAAGSLAASLVGFPETTRFRARVTRVTLRPYLHPRQGCPVSRGPFNSVAPNHRLCSLSCPLIVTFWIWFLAVDYGDVLTRNGPSATTLHYYIVSPLPSLIRHFIKFKNEINIFSNYLTPLKIYFCPNKISFNFFKL